MLNISGIHEGYVLDHIQAGMSMKIYDYLRLGELGDATIAMIMNAKSQKMGHKDIIKIECPLGTIDLDILGYIDHNITVDVIKDDQIIRKEKLSLPKQVVNVKEKSARTPVFTRDSGTLAFHNCRRWDINIILIFRNCH